MREQEKWPNKWAVYEENGDMLGYQYFDSKNEAIEAAEIELSRIVPRGKSARYHLVECVSPLRAMASMENYGKLGGWILHGVNTFLSKSKFHIEDQTEGYILSMPGDGLANLGQAVRYVLLNQARAEIFYPISKETRTYTRPEY